MGLQTTSYTPTSSGVARYFKNGDAVGSGYMPNGASRFTYVFNGNASVGYIKWDQKWAVITIKTDAAGCSSLSWSCPGDKHQTTIKWKISSSSSLSEDGMTNANYSSGTWSGTWSSGLIANQTYYLIICAPYPSGETSDGSHVTGCWGTLTLSPSGTYGKPGTITANNTNFDSPINMSYASATSGGTYTVTVKVGTSSAVTLQTKSSTSSRSWTPSLATYGPSYTNVSSVSCVITVSTYFGGVLSGTKTKTVTISFTAAQAGPTTSTAFSIAPYNTSPISGMTGYIQGYSKIRATYTSGNVTLKYGATVSKWTVKFGSASAVDVAAGTATKDSSAISADTSVTCTVVDSRGFTASETYTATITPYQNPSLTVSAFRSDSGGNAADDGTYLCVDLSGLYADIAAQNSLVAEAYSKLASASTYGAAVTITGGTTTLSGTNNTYTVTGFLISGYTDAVYDIKFVVTDALGNTASYTIQIESQAWAIHFRNKGAGAAIGKAAERDNELDIGNWHFTCGDIYLKGRDDGGVIQASENIATKIGDTIPQSNIYSSGIYVDDKNDYRCFYSEIAKTPADDLYRSYVLRRRSSDGNTIYYNGFYLHIDASGNPSVTFNNTAVRNAWRSALGIS